MIGATDIIAAIALLFLQLFHGPLASKQGAIATFISSWDYYMLLLSLGSSVRKIFGLLGVFRYTDIWVL